MILEDYISAWAARSFDWNSRATCVHFAAGWVRMFESRDPLRSVPEFKGKLAAGRTLLQYGSLKDAATQCLGRAPLLTPSLAQVGDVVLLPGQSYGTLGLCNGRNAAVLLEEGGVGFVEMDKAEAAWRVGEY